MNYITNRYNTFENEARFMKQGLFYYYGPPVVQFMTFGGLSKNIVFLKLTPGTMYEKVVQIRWIGST